MSAVRSWLEGVGLSQYAEVFEANDIDMDLLKQVGDQTLKDMGVSSAGHRLRLLNAIAKLTVTAAPDSNAGGSGAPGEVPSTTAERRQLTVMFCDFVGSTALSVRLDPEDLRSIIGSYHRCCTEQVQRNGGFVAKYLGDGVLAYFGYPRAHEDDAERAVRAGLALVEALSKQDVGAGEALRVRVGIATGLVVVGDLLGKGAAQEQAVVGETPNLAARLQSLAEPNAVVIGPSTHGLVGQLFDYRDLGTVELKGFAEAVQAWQVLGESAVESRFEALRPSQTPLVGRAEEIELLLRRWQQVKSGQGHVVLLTGEPGIGKSRIVAALQERLKDDPHTRLRYFCLPHHQDSALHPQIGQIQRAAGFAREETAETKIAKLEALLARSDATPEETGYIAELLSIPTGERYPLPGLSPQKRKERTLAALLAQMERLAARQPVLVVYEDVHWIDPTTLELLTLAIERVQRHPVLLLVTARPEFRPPWPSHAHMATISLGRIGRDEGASLIVQVSGGKGLPSDVLQQILARTDGVPLFIEELTKTVIESGVLVDAGDRFTMAGPLPPMAIPTTLNASLLARLDRLAPVREVAQIGAALGRQFSHELISAVSPMSQQQLDDALAQLVSTELIFRRGIPPDAEYTFKHALVQDAAYGTLLRSRRQQLHARIAATLEGQFPKIAEMQPELLAQHCAEAGLIEKAVGYWLRAGQQAAARFAVTEAVAQLRKGIDILSSVPDGTARREQELELQITLGRALIMTKGNAAPESGEAFARARQLCEQLTQPPQLGAVLHGQWVFRTGRGELAQAQHHAEEMYHLGETRKGIWRFIGAAVNGLTSVSLGRFGEARAHCESGHSLWDPMYRGNAQTAEDPYVVNLLVRYRTLLCLGYVDQARSWRDMALAEARRLSPFTQAYSLDYAWLGDWASEGAESARTMLRSAQEVVAISNEQGFILHLGIGTIMRGWCLGALGQAEEGIPLILQGLATVSATGRKLLRPFFLTTLADVYRMAARPQEGLERLAEAAELVETTQERWAEAEMHRLRGTLLLCMHEHAAAEDSYRHALVVARQQSARFWELRAALDLARLWRDQGKRAEARDLLTPVYGWFTEGFDTPVLRDAKELLDELR
jgi:class 3 adenylate cyclase/predicted ATPase